MGSLVDMADMIQAADVLVNLGFKRSTGPD
jgi:hypothetical protein